MKARVIFFLFFLLMSCCSFAQPTPRATGQLFYLRNTQSLLLFDGYEKGTTPAGGKAETWAWKNNSWTKLDENDQPMRSLSAAVYMNDKDQVIVFGGIGSRGYDDSLRQACTFNGKDWKCSDNNLIGTRDHHEMAYDEHNKTIVLYGGQTGNRELDTRIWIYKNDQWTALDIPGPGPRVHHAMAYDAERKKIVLFGGSGGGQEHDEIWEFDGTAWKKIETAVNPGRRAHHAMVYDPSRKKILLYGGEIDMNVLGDVWSWDGMNWEKLSINGPARLLPALAFNSDNNKLYVFGGNGGEHGTTIYSDLWEWNGQDWKQVGKGKAYKWDMQKDMYVEGE